MNSAADRIAPIIRKLKKQYPDAKCSLDYRNPLELLVATILSAQCTDTRVNVVTKNLFRKYKSAGDYANADPDELSDMIKSTGFFRNKRKSLIGMGAALAERHEGRVPQTLDELTKIPGVGRKTANVVLGNAFNKNEGIVVDTHVSRISRRLRLTRKNEAVKIERDLMRIVSREEWTLFPHLLIHHGRAICQARKPKCEICPVNMLCPSSDA
ncbi:MAG: endonuclease III [Gemmatimonadales bacterium]